MNRCLSSGSNLKQFLLNRSTDKMFWYFHDSNHFKELTFRNENSLNVSDNETVLRKQLSNSIIKDANYLLNHNNYHHFRLVTKLYILDAISIIHGTNHKNTINYFDSLRPQIIFELQKQDIYVLIQLLYFSSIITTENRDDYNCMLSKIIDQIDDYFSKNNSNSIQLKSTDIAVLCHYLFKLKVKLKTKSIYNLFSQIVVDDIKNNRINKSYVLSIVKYMRLNDYSDEKFVEALKSFIKVHSNKFSFLECAHYLAFFANVSVYETEVYHYLVDERSSKLLEVDSIKLSNGEKLRSKDLARFLWSVSLMNHKLSQNLITSICKHVESLMATDFVYYPHFLLDCLKSLIIMEIYPQNILLKALNSKKFIELFSVSKRDKLALDLYFILESIAIERPSLKLERRTLLYSIAKQPNKSIKIESRNRPQLLKFFNLIKSKQNMEISVDLNYIFSHFGIASLLVKGISLEIIDQTLIIGNSSQHLNGLMRTKLRQLDKRNISYQLICNSEDLEKFFNSL